MSIRKAIGKMAFDYENHRKFYTSEIRYAYEELCVVCQEIESGVENWRLTAIWDREMI